MPRRNPHLEHITPPGGTDSGNTAKDYLALLGVVLTVVGVFVVGAVALWSIFAFLLGDRAGAVTRPDYADLGSQAPDVVMFELHPDGTAHVEFTIPAGAAPQAWHVATFHVPNPDDWHADQTLIDGGPAGPLGSGVYRFTLRTAPGACQVDMWFEGEQPYAADTSLGHDWASCAPAVAADPTPVSFGIPDPTLSAAPADNVDPPAQDSAPASGVSGGGGTVTSNPSGSVLSPAVTSTATQLAATGGTEGLLLVAACLIVAGFGFVAPTRRRRS